MRVETMNENTSNESYGKTCYERASMEVVIFDAEDVITTSTGDGTIKLPFIPRT